MRQSAADTQSANRVAGAVGSIGRYAAPSFHAASIEAIRSGPRSSRMPTTAPVSTPRSRSWSAIWSARVFRVA